MKLGRFLTTEQKLTLLIYLYFGCIITTNNSTMQIFVFLFLFLSYKNIHNEVIGKKGMRVTQLGIEIIGIAEAD